MRGLAISIIVVVAIVVLFFLGLSRVPDMIAKNLSKKLGVAVSIESMHFKPSQITVNKIEIGNPRGYSLPKAFSAETIELETPVTHYFHDKVVIDEIHVDNIYLGLEFDTTTGAEGNWTKIMKQYQEKANLNEDKEDQIFIRKLILTNIQTELLFRSEGGKIQKLPTIQRIELNNISTEGGFPTDQLMNTILGQMLKEVFKQQNLNNMLKGIWESPGKAIDPFVKPFKEFFNSIPRKQMENIFQKFQNSEFSESYCNRFPLHIPLEKEIRKEKAIEEPLEYKQVA